MELAEPVSTKDEEIDEVMEFLTFSVKPSSTFTGTILFNFRDDGNAGNASTYAVKVAKNRDVTTKKNASSQEVDAAAEVTISVDDFLWIYSGKASSSDILKLFYAGRLSVGGWAFRKVSAFAQSFDFSSETWRNFYLWRDNQDTIASLDGPNRIETPPRDYYVFCCRSILERCNVPKLQRMQWEISLGSLFGGSYTKMLLSSPSAAPITIPNEELKNLSDQLANVLGSPSWYALSQSKMKDRPTLATSSHAYIHPIELNTSVASEYSRALAVHRDANVATQVFAFFDEQYVEDVRASAKERYSTRFSGSKNRLDLGEAGREQLDRLVQIVGVGGHTNDKRNNKSKYIPAPEMLLREFRMSATAVMEKVRDTARGRPALNKIPPPSVDFLAQPSTEAHWRSPVDTSALPRRRRRRDLQLHKQKLKAKVSSLSRELATRPVATNVDETLAFSDYL